MDLRYLASLAERGIYTSISVRSLVDVRMFNQH